MRNSLLTSNFLITLIKAMKKIKQRFKMSGTDIESIFPFGTGAASGDPQKPFGVPQVSF